MGPRCVVKPRRRSRRDVRREGVRAARAEPQKRRVAVAFVRYDPAHSGSACTVNGCAGDCASEAERVRGHTVACVFRFVQPLLVEDTRC